MVDERGHAEGRREPGGDRRLVPRRLSDLDVRQLDGAGQAHAHAADRHTRRADLVHEALEPPFRRREHRVDAVGDRHLDEPVGDEVAGEIGHTQPHPGHADLGREDPTAGRIEGERGRRPAAAVDREVDGGDETVLDQAVDALAHRRSRDAHRVGQFVEGRAAEPAEMEQRFAGPAHAQRHRRPRAGGAHVPDIPTHAHGRVDDYRRSSAEFG